MTHRPKSPYQRYGKKPYRYSAELRACTKVRQFGTREDIEEADRAWEAKHHTDPERREAAQTGGTTNG